MSEHNVSPYGQVYDFVLTIDREIHLIWPTPLKATKVIILVNRYLPFVDTSFALYQNLGFNKTVDACKMAYYTSGFLYIIGVALAELILTLRVWALWNCSRTIAIGMSIFFLAVLAPIIVAVVLHSNSLVFSSLTVHLGCTVVKRNSMLAVVWILLAVYEAAMWALMALRAISVFREGGQSRLGTIVYKDGFIYYSYIVVLSLVNVCVIFALPADLFDMLSGLERVLRLHSIFTGRVIFHIRAESGKRDSADILSMPLPSMEFIDESPAKTTEEPRETDNTSCV